jgi:hypothetical protein
MKSIDKYVVVVPTHRIKHLRKNLKSILSQTVKPDLIIAIDDTDYLLNPEIKKEFDEINKNIPVKYYNKNDDTLSGTLQKNGAVRAFLNIFLCLKDTFQNNEENIFIHILEDDCYYIRKNTIEKFKNTHSKFQKNLYRLNLIENEEDLQNALRTSINKDVDKLRNNFEYATELIDTSGFIFKYDFNIIEGINNYLKDKGYTLSADMYVFEILFNYYSKEFVDLNSFMIFSTQHPDQVSRTFDNDLEDESHKWLFDLKNFNIDINQRNLLEEFSNNLVEIKERRDPLDQLNDEEYRNIPSVQFAIQNKIKIEMGSKEEIN